MDRGSYPKYLPELNPQWARNTSTIKKLGNVATHRRRRQFSRMCLNQRQQTTHPPCSLLLGRTGKTTAKSLSFAPRIRNLFSKAS